MVVVVSLVLVTMFIYANRMYFILALLVMMLCLLGSLVSSLSLSSLTMIMFAIVYIGAMMILIGYICAVCPNLILTPTHISWSSVFFLFVVFYFCSGMPVAGFSQSSMRMFDYFYSSAGFVTLGLIVVMLFVTLLMVTSQYLAPKGPFRSVRA